MGRPTSAVNVGLLRSKAIYLSTPIYPKAFVALKASSHAANGTDLAAHARSGFKQHHGLSHQNIELAFS